MIFVLFLTSLLRGPGDKPSLIGVSRCDDADFAFFGCLIGLGLVFTIIGRAVVVSEYEQKKSLGYKFVPGDFVCTPCNSIKLPLTALFGGIAAAALGIGAGLIFNPVII